MEAQYSGPRINLNTVILNSHEHILGYACHILPKPKLRGANNRISIMIKI